MAKLFYSKRYLSFLPHSMRWLELFTIKQKTVFQTDFLSYEGKYLRHIYNGEIKRPENEWFPHS